MILYDLKNKRYIEKKDNKSLHILYDTVLGRVILKIAYKKKIANIYAKIMNSKVSRMKIKRFIKSNNINIDEYKEKKYNSFNDFFTRELKSSKRVIDDGIIAVCDSKVSAYKINKNSKFKIKNSIYTVEELIQEKNKTNYKYAIIFRLDVDDYHHYVFPDDGKIIKTKNIEGILHTVQPISQKKYKVFIENSRCVTYLDCKNLGNVCYIEVGAMMIGKISNHKIKNFKKGDEKGYFEFGGSTIILLIEKDIKINNIIIDNTKKDLETIVKLGNTIGK